MRRLACGMALLAWLWPGNGPAQTHDHGAHGAAAPAGDFAELVRLARDMNPEAAAKALMADAAAARVAGEGSLPDPMFRVSIEDLPRDRDDAAPRINPGQVKYSVVQQLPFFGKRGLRADVAEAGAQAARAEARAAVNEVVARVKTAYADYHKAHLAMEQTQTLVALMRTIAELTQLRYAQGLGSQQDAATAEYERAELAAELVRLEADRHRARARINALVDRAAQAPVIETPQPRPIPPPSQRQIDALVERALAGNPMIGAEDARIAGAGKEQDLATREWFPDVGLGVTAVRRNDRIDAYEAMVEVNLPLQWGLRQSKQQSAAAESAAARSRRQAAARAIEADLHQAWRGLEAALATAKIFAEGAIPQAGIAFRSAVKSYELGRSSLTEVLLAEQRLRRAEREYRNVLFEQQSMLADIERLVGEDL